MARLYIHLSHISVYHICLYIYEDITGHNALKCCLKSDNKYLHALCQLLFDKHVPVCDFVCVCTRVCVLVVRVTATEGNLK